MPFSFTWAALWRQARTQKALGLLLLVTAGSWGLFLEVAHELREDRLQPDHGFPFDRPVLDYLHQQPTPLLCTLARLLSDLKGPLWLSGYALVVGAGWWLWRQRRMHDLWFSVGALGGTMALNLLAKYHFERLRPDFYPQVCFAPLHQLTDPSFPSGHTMASLALACTAGILSWRSCWRWLVWAAGLLLALGVAWSRLYLAEHYPSDVLASWFATAAWVGSFYVVWSPYAGRLRRLWQRRPS